MKLVSTGFKTKIERKNVPSTEIETVNQGAGELTPLAEV